MKANWDVRVRIDQQFDCETTQTGHESIEFRFETTVGTKRLDTTSIQFLLTMSPPNHTLSVQE